MPTGSEQLDPIYCSCEFAFVMDNLGRILVYDRDFQYKSYDTFNKTGKKDLVFRQENQPLLLNENKALYILYSDTVAPSIGTLEFKEEPEFRAVEVDYMESNNQYKILYQDAQEKEIYIVKSNDKKASLLIIDNENYKLLYEIPIEYAHLLDFVIKN